MLQKSPTKQKVTLTLNLEKHMEIMGFIFS
jgi:hypothetical protein